MTGLRELTRQLPRRGRVEAIFLRPQRGVAALRVPTATALIDRGLAGDRTGERAASQSGGGKRQVTLIQAEHLPVIAAWAGLDEIDPAALRRNLLISGLNLIAVRSPFADRPLKVWIGSEVALVITGAVRPVLEDGGGAGAGRLQRHARPRRDDGAGSVRWRHGGGRCGSGRGCARRVVVGQPPGPDEADG